MKFTSVLLTVTIAVLLQVSLARFTVGGTWVFDLVLVGVVFAGLQWGSSAGLVAGTLGGMLQDVLSGQIVGVSGLAKTIVGFGAGVIGSQFVLTRAYARSIIVIGSSLVHRVLMLGLSGLIAQQWPVVSWGTVAVETGLNTLAGLVVFQVAAGLPGMMARQRASRRSSLSRRQW